MNELINTLNSWLTLHPQLVTVVIAGMAFVESLAMIGIIIPGVAILFATAVLAGGLSISLPQCLIAAMIGASAGDIGSFLLGRHAHTWALKSWPFDRHPEWIDKGERFFNRYGSYSVVIGRFIGPIRPILPFVAGMLYMPPRRFIAINLASVLVWAPVYILPGYLLGSSAQQLSAADASLSHWQSTELVGTVIGSITLLGLLLAWLVHRWLVDDGQRQPARQTGQILATKKLMIAGLALLGVTILGYLLDQTTLFEEFNRNASLLFNQLRRPEWDPLIIAFTLAGDGACLLMLSLVCWSYYWKNGNRRLVLHWLAALVAVVIVNQLIKIGLAIPRPQLLAHSLQSFAFPSAHTSNSSLFFLLLSAFAATRLTPHFRRLSYLSATVAILLMGFSRLYLGVHWFTDIAAGILLATAVALITLWSYQRGISARSSATSKVPVNKAQSQKMNAAWLLLMLSIAAIYIIWKLPAATLHYQPI